MTNKATLIALYTIVRREIRRMFRIASQVFLPPVITTALYFLIFGTLIGQRIGLIHGVSYPLFIAPGLILMSVITNAYGNVSTSLFSARFQKSIEEMIVSPMPNYLLLIGYVTGGVIRGVIVGILVFIVSAFFVDVDLHHLGFTFLILIAVSALFSLAGFTNAVVARSFDDVAIIPTFLLTPLTYLGGVFYDVDMLPPFWQTISHFNPILYMVNLFRYAMLGLTSIPVSEAILVITLTIVFLIFLNMYLLYRGVGLRD
ncbi:ABC transporter permease [Legionella sp. W05-934-2]|jgi:ABC-2 type transport system permease protein|uniref:ABC transporter permease n=1 Tax=Legionella sp. W05-934-2 TaxID=1198649 RepID=UPI003461C787